MIKKINKAIEKFLNDGMTEAGKARIIANIERANSQECKKMLEIHEVNSQVIDGILNDPYWITVIKESIEAGTL